MKKVVIIVAGGRGKRMKSDTPKQFLPIYGFPVLMHTVKKFYRHDNSIMIIIVLPKTQIKLWKKLCRDYKFNYRHDIVQGGVTRFHSVKNGLSKIKGEDWLVAIHDGVRPLVSLDTIRRCFKKAAASGNAVPAIEIPESMREIDKSGNRPADRSKFKLIQTPQVFHVKFLKEAFKQGYKPEFTDDASVVESMGHAINLVEGNKENIKITTPSDLLVAESYLKKIK
jgi:2-C-methyl-D-erythritol 4-phosphate cytidylyltransferase